MPNYEDVVRKWLEKRNVKQEVPEDDVTKWRKINELNKSLDAQHAIIQDKVGNQAQGEFNKYNTDNEKFNKLFTEMWDKKMVQVPEPPKAKKPKLIV